MEKSGKEKKWTKKCRKKIKRKGTRYTLLTTVSERLLIFVVIQSELTGDLLDDVGASERSCCARLFDSFPFVLELASAGAAVVDERWRVVAVDALPPVEVERDGE